MADELRYLLRSQAGSIPWVDSAYGRLCVLRLCFVLVAGLVRTARLLMAMPTCVTSRRTCTAQRRRTGGASLTKAWFRQESSKLSSESSALTSALLDRELKLSFRIVAAYMRATALPRRLSALAGVCFVYSFHSACGMSCFGGGAMDARAC